MTRWGADEDAVLRVVYPVHGAAACARCLPQRTAEAIRTRAKQLGVRGPGYWTEAERAVLREHYPRGGTAACVPHLPGRSPAGIMQQAAKLGLTAPAECPGRHRFRRGNDPWNKGIKGYRAGGRSAETRFQPGNRPRNWQPVGHERICNGFLQRKVTDTGYTPRDYRPVHHLLWEQRHGPIPPGHVVAFVNGDRTDIRLDNVVLISRSELMARNSIHHLPETLRQVITAQARLTRVIGELGDEKPSRRSERPSVRDHRGAAGQGGPDGPGSGEGDQPGGTDDHR